MDLRSIATPSKIIFLIVVLFLVVGFVAFLQMQNKPSEQTRNYPDKNPDIRVSTSPLTKTTWRLASYVNEDGTETVIPDDVTITSTFGEDNIISGNGGCNSYSGQYTDIKGKLKIGETRTTAMYCEPGGKYEGGFFTALGKSTGYEISDTSLTISDSKGNAVLKYKSLSE